MTDPQPAGLPPGPEAPVIYAPSGSAIVLTWLGKHYRGVLLFGGLVAAIAIGASLSAILNPVLLALLIAYILNPVVNAIERFNVDRRVVCVMLMVGFFWLCALGALWIGRTADQQITALVDALTPEPKLDDLNGNGIVDEDLFQVFDRARGNPTGVYAQRTAGSAATFIVLESHTTYRLQFVPFERKTGINYRPLPHGALPRDDPRRALGKLAFEDYDGNGNWDPDWQEPLLVWKDDDGQLYAIEAVEHSTRAASPAAARLLQLDARTQELRYAEFIDTNDNGRYDGGLLYKIELLANDAIALYNERHQDDPISLQRLFRAFEQQYLRPDRPGPLATATFDIISFVLSTVSGGLFALFTFLFLLVLIPIYTFFFLKGMSGIKQNLITYLPGRHRQHVLAILIEIHFAVKSFFRGRLAICFLVGLVTGIGLAALGVRFWLLLALVNAVAIIVPFASTIVGLIPALLIVFATHDPGQYAFGLVGTQVWVVVLYIGIQGVEQYLLTPTILGREVELHPITLLVVLFTGAHVLGLFGVLIAVPIASVVKILAREFLLPVLKSFAAQPPVSPAQAPPAAG